MARPVREELTPKQLSCISELVMKDITGKTNEQIANELGINLATLYRWRKNKMFNDRLTAEAEELNKSYLADFYLFQIHLNIFRWEAESVLHLHL